MKCHVEGCGRDARYKTAQLCQKHYFRIRRNDSIETVLEKKKRETGITRQPRVTMPGKGYQRLYDPAHPLADTQGYVSEHRKIVYARYGDVLPGCELCGVAVNWETVHIDHIDRDVKNNAPDNLRPLCRNCNTRRDMPPAHTFSHTHALTFDGKTDTAAGWARDPRIKVDRKTIVMRKQAGMSDHDALFAPKLTHNGKLPVKLPTPPKHTRRNAVNIMIDGEMKTSSEWSRDPRCAVSDATLRARVKAGWRQDSSILLPVAGYESRAKLRALKEAPCSP